MVEGILFRLKEVLDGLGGDGRILITGGLTREAALPRALAALLKHPVHLVDEPDATLLGAARLAADLLPGLTAKEIPPDAGEGNYLAEKYPRWQKWMRTVLRATPE